MSYNNFKFGKGYRLKGFKLFGKEDKMAMIICRCVKMAGTNNFRVIVVCTNREARWSVGAQYSVNDAWEIGEVVPDEEMILYEL